MSTKIYGAWLQTGFDAWSLGAEAAVVAGLRMAKIAAGGKAGAREAELMVAEKVQAGIELQSRLLTGRLGLSPLAGTRNTLRHYRRKVAANRKRLSR